MTGKEYLIDYIQNHNGEEIYEIIKKIEHLSSTYTDSRGVFIDFLNNEDMGELFKSYINMQKLVQDKYGSWFLITGDKNEI